MIYDALEKVRIIRDRLKTTYSQRKSNVDNRRIDLEFEVGDMVYLKISHIKGVMRIVKKEKLSPQYVGPYEIVKWAGKVVYELKFPSELASVHPILHISIF